MKVKDLINALQKHNPENEAHVVLAFGDLKEQVWLDVSSTTEIDDLSTVDVWLDSKEDALSEISEQAAFSAEAFDN